MTAQLGEMSLNMHACHQCLDILFFHSMSFQEFAIEEANWSDPLLEPRSKSYY